MPAAHKWALWPIVALLLAVFAWGGWQVLSARLESGDVYPPYSSLRADPLGAKALFDSLSELRELSVSRLYKNESPLEPETSLLVLGADSFLLASAPKEALKEYEKLLTGGGRVVIAFLPTYSPVKAPKTDMIDAEWQIRPQYRKTPDEARSPAEMPQQTDLYFDPETEWRVLARNDNGATVVERNLGHGTLVLVADSFPLSNQGLAQRNDSTLIAKIVGAAQRVIFDENHLGVVESGSVAMLVHKYRLEGALAMLLLVAGLFIWRSASSFLPPQEGARKPSAQQASAQRSPISGRDSKEGLAALLRRSVREAELLEACLAEWRRTNSRDSKFDLRVNLVETEIKQWAGRDPMEGYRAACRALTEKK